MFVNEEMKRELSILEEGKGIHIKNFVVKNGYSYIASTNLFNIINSSQLMVRFDYQFKKFDNVDYFEIPSILIENGNYAELLSLYILMKYSQLMEDKRVYKNSEFISSVMSACFKVILMYCKYNLFNKEKNTINTEILSSLRRYAKCNCLGVQVIDPDDSYITCKADALVLNGEILKPFLMDIPTSIYLDICTFVDMLDTSSYTTMYPHVSMDSIIVIVTASVNRNFNDLMPSSFHKIITNYYIRLMKELYKPHSSYIMNSIAF